MTETLRKLISKSGDLYTFTINKKNDFDKNSWEFYITDKDSNFYGLSGKLCDYDCRMVTLRRGEHFFFAYKILTPDNKYTYFVDVRKANHKTSVLKYVDGVVNFYLKSNDISFKKDDSSFKISEMKMKTVGIRNILDLCYFFREYSAVGTGLTRDIRNLIVLDIDVDCRKKENEEELKRLLCIFASHKILPDFEIHNNGNGHIQLQWLIQSYKYKEKNEEQIKELVSKLNEEKNKNREINSQNINFNFTKDCAGSCSYRQTTKALTCVSEKPKFGDKNFTFWKAKNFCTALFRMQNLELKMPKLVDGKITYLPQEEMVDLFSTPEKRKKYFENSYSFEKFFEYTLPFLSKYMYEDLEGSENHIDVEEMSEIYDSDYEHNEKTEQEDSRNNFVFRYTKTVTWDICREQKFKSFEDIAKLSKKDLKKLENTVHKIVLEEYERLDKKYGGGRWPGTSNGVSFSKKEFESAFKMAFNFAKCKFNNLSKYSDEQREKSMKERGVKKSMKLVLVDYLRNKNKDIKRDELLKLVNNTLVKSKQKKISLSSLKRYIEFSKTLSETDRKNLYLEYYQNVKDRKHSLSDIQKDSDNTIKNKKKRFDNVSINIIDEIMKNLDS